jgi:hypothetical protein
MEIKQPFSILDIKKYPTQVLIATLIGLLIYFIGKADNEADEVLKLNAQINTIYAERNALYEKIIFQDRQLKSLQNSIPVDELREQTQQPVNKILKSE